MAFLEYTPRQTLYQYSSVDSFRKLIASKVLWCTDLTAANDPRELKLGFEHMLDALRLVRTDEYKGRAGEFLEDIISRVTIGHERQQFFCACFSLLSDALPMWREYGDNYRGVAFGFRPSAITAMPGRIQKVKYLDENLAAGYRQLVHEMASEYDPNHSHDDLGYWIKAATSILAAATALKHQSWEYEKEIRFVFAQVRADPGNETAISEFADGTPVHWEAPLSRQRGDALVEYKAFQFGRRKQGRHEFSHAIAQLVIGPRSELTIEEAKTELLRNGFEDVSVVKSECEIR